MSGSGERRVRTGLLSLALKVVITAAGIGFLVATTDLAAAGRALTNAAPLWAALGLAAFSSCIAPGAWRWQLLLRCDGADPGRLELALVYFEASFFGLFLPSALGGDLFRGWRIRHLVGGTREAVVNLAVERIIGLASVGAMGLFAVALDPGLEPQTHGALIVASLAVLALAAVLVWPAASRTVARIVARLRLRSISTFLERTADQIGGYHRQRGTLVAALILSAVQHVLAIAAIACSSLAVGIELEPAIYVAAFPIISLLALFPSIGGIGPREVGLAFVLESGGTNEASAVAAAAIFLAINIARGLIGGLIYLVRRPPPGQRPRSI